MIDIIEAGKFYNDCLKKVKESTLKENILPENTVLNAKVDLMQYGGRLTKTLVGAFELNGVDYTFEVDVEHNNTMQVMAYKATEAIAKRIAKAVAQKMNWSEYCEPPNLP